MWFYTASTVLEIGLQDTLTGWRFVVTKKGFVGVVPNMARVGDVVAIFKGGRVPFVVQRSGAREEAWRLVGECYVHCLMNGEVWACLGLWRGSLGFFRGTYSILMKVYSGLEGG